MAKAIRITKMWKLCNTFITSLYYVREIHTSQDIFHHLSTALVNTAWRTSHQIHTRKADHVWLFIRNCQKVSWRWADLSMLLFFSAALLLTQRTMTFYFDKLRFFAYFPVESYPLRWLSAFRSINYVNQKFLERIDL